MDKALLTVDQRNLEFWALMSYVCVTRHNYIQMTLAECSDTPCLIHGDFGGPGLGGCGSPCDPKTP